MTHIDKLFKERLMNQEAVVPEGMWEKIAPAIEEESGRGLIWWLWLAGILALGIAGIALFLTLSNKEKTESEPETLVLLDEHPERNYSQTLLESHTAAEISNSTSAKDLSKKSEANTSESLLISDAPLKNTSTENKSISKKTKVQNSTPPTHSNSSNSSEINGLQDLPNVGGEPTNLLITKSYISKTGSVVTQSSLSGNHDSAPVYEVLLNSEAKDIEPGTLLRLVEPVQEIALPGFGKSLKKKNLAQSI